MDTGAGNKKIAAQIFDDKNQQVRFLPRSYKAQVPGTSFPLSNGLWVGAAGNVQVVTHDGDNIVIPGVQAGTYLIGQFTQVVAAGTTVADPEDNILVVY